MPDGHYDLRIQITDNADNVTTTDLPDKVVPTLADPGQYLNGTVSLSASSDPDTTQVDFERRPAGGGSWVTIASDTTTPWGTSLDTTSLADGLYDFRAIATDQTGHTGTSPVRANVRVDNTSPAGSLTTPANGATVGGTSVALSGSYSDGGSGVASVRYELRPTGGGSWATIATSTSSPFSASWDATTVTSGSYDLQPVITDNAGNSFTGPMRTITVDVSAPTVVLTNPGATISGSVTLNARERLGSNAGRVRGHAVRRRFVVVTRDGDDCAVERDRRHHAASGWCLRPAGNRLGQSRQYLLRRRHRDPGRQHRPARGVVDTRGRLDSSFGERDRPRHQRGCDARRRDARR